MWLLIHVIILMLFYLISISKRGRSQVIYMITNEIESCKVLISEENTYGKQFLYTNYAGYIHAHIINTLRPRQNGHHFPDDIFKWIFLNENVWIVINISLKFVPRGPIKNIPTLVQVMAWRRPGDMLLFEPMMVSLLTHICFTRPQWVNEGFW